MYGFSLLLEKVKKCLSFKSLILKVFDSFLNLRLSSLMTPKLSFLPEKARFSVPDCSFFQKSPMIHNSGKIRIFRDVSFGV